MKNLWRGMAPFATDTSGACTLFYGANALLIALDSNGTVSTLRRIIDINAGQCVYATIDLPDISFTLGRERDFIERMSDLLAGVDVYRLQERLDPTEYLVLVNGPVSTLLGMDIAGYAQRLEDEVGKRVLFVDTTGNAYYDKGLAKGYEAIYQQVVLPALEEDPDAPRIENGVNLLGVNVLDHPGAGMIAKLRTEVHQRDGEVVSNWGYSDFPEKWRRAGRVGKNVVCSVSGLGVARRMERELGIPFETIDQLDWFDDWTEGLELAGSPSVLIVGEQLSSNLLRRLLVRMGAGRVDVATFFTLDKRCKQQGDFRLKAQSDLAPVLGSDEYDLVVSDHVFKKHAALKHITLMHPPVGFGRRDTSSLERDWLNRLARTAAEITGQRASSAMDARGHRDFSL